jgi:predicted nucleic acid-binding protein
MRAVDTNIIIRFLTNDDAEQAARARRLFDHEDVFVPIPVLLETEWVLRAVYGFAAADVVGALRRFAGLPHVSVENASVAAQALDWADHGLDLADALHLSAAQQHDGFISFDRQLARIARKLGAPEVAVP